MKKAISLMLAAVMLLPLAACAKSGNVTTTEKADSTVITTDGDSAVEPITDVDLSKLLSADSSDVERQMKNPVLSKTSDGANTGDPFVMRWNGKYYLYYTSTGVECWTSDDLLKWEHVGTVAVPEDTVIAYAPEVVYYNGYFYMYTSPCGNGHRVLRSDSPTGLFESVTGNIGLSIDGSVFIDDDGKWYFYRASGEGIRVHEMQSPTNISSSSITATSAMEDNWTEAPSVVKYNGVYFMTYSGNHYLSPGYRINYAYATRRPTNFRTPDDNPLLVNTVEAKGIGHNSMVIAPNLDGYYMVYHAMPNTDGVRDTRIDRVYYNNTVMQVLGETTGKTEAPTLPDVYNSFTSSENLSEWTLSYAEIENGVLAVKRGGKALTNEKFDGNYTAELNVKSIKSGKAGALFGYTDENNYGSALFDPDTQELVVTFTVNGVSTENRLPLIKSFNENLSFDCLQLLTVKREGTTYTFYVNNLKTGTLESKLAGGSFGCTAIDGTASFGYAALGKYVNQSYIKDFFKPVSGEFFAVTCLENDITVVETTMDNSEVNAVSAKKDDYFNYHVNVEANGTYDFAVKYTSTADSKIEIYQNGEYVGALELPSNEDKSSVAILNNAALKSGYSVITVRVLTGSANIISYEVDRSKEVETLDIDDFTGKKVLYSDGSWSKSEQLTLSAKDSAGKIAYGKYDWNNYTVETVIKPTSGKLGCGVIIRGSDLSNGGANDSPTLGKNFMNGYLVVMERGTLKIYRMNYGREQAAKCFMKFSANTEYTLTITAVGATITVSVNGEKALEYTDSDPFLQGAVGFAGYSTEFEVKSLKVYEAE